MPSLIWNYVAPSIAGLGVLTSLASGRYDAAAFAAAWLLSEVAHIRTRP